MIIFNAYPLLHKYCVAWVLNVEIQIDLKKLMFRPV